MIKTMTQWRISENGFWRNSEKWRKMDQGALEWANGWLRNGNCADCKLCCGPQGINDPPFPMPLLASQVSAETPDDFYLLDESTPYIGAQGCKSASPSGCRLSSEKKPIACRLFPLVLIEGKFYLYQNCPAVLFTPLLAFMELAEKAAEWLAEFPLEELRRLSISMPCETLSAKYIDLHIRIFECGEKILLKE